MNSLQKFAAAETQRIHHQTMPKLALDLNSRVFVNFNPLSSESVPLQGEFLGTSHYEFLIIRLPSIPGLLKKMLPHLRIEISFLSGGARNSFIAEIITYTARPALLLFTSYPDRMSVMETRKSQRVTCAVPASLITPYGDALAVISDLSNGGCRVVMEMTGQSTVRKITEGDRVVMQLPLSPQESQVRGIGLVRSVETSGSRLTLGLAFEEKNGRFIDSVAAYLELVAVLS
ncbi:flagellar brake protein [Desulfovibrio sp. OttesenSCG-928-F20]|nr:flagellar brake protein [Desulfovibrio sp. OttesenSCG-928-F20]